MNRHNTYFIECCLVFCLLVMAILAPRQYDFNYCIVSFLICFIGVASFFSYWKRTNNSFLDFATIFVVVALIMGFTFPLLIYDNSSTTAYFFSWGLPYSLDYFNKGACLSGLGIVSFMAGSTSKVRISQSKSFNIIKTNIIIYFIWTGFIILFVGLGGFEKYQNIYQGTGNDFNPILPYCEVFIIAISQIILANECWNLSRYEKYKASKISILIVIFVSLTFMYVGSRTICLYLLLPFIIFISSRYIKINLKYFMILLVIGGGFMIGSMLFRSREGFNEDLDWFYYMVDLMNPNTTTYLSCEIVDQTGYTLGESMLGSLFGIIPFGQSLLQMFFGLTPEFTNSAAIFTCYLGVQVAGTGTNFISDSYLAFGCIGVLLISYYSGKIISYFRINQNNSYYKFIIYMIICGFSVYAVRASFIYILRFMLYGLLFAYLNLNLQYQSK